MTTYTQFCRKIKDDEFNNSKGRQGNGKESTARDTFLDRSVRETLSKNTMNPSSVVTRKSELLEKRTSIALVKGKSNGIENQKTPSPLKSSERVTMLSSSSSAGPKKSDKSLDLIDIRRQKEKKEKQLTMETEEVSKIEKRDGEKKSYNAYSYRALFRTRRTKMVGAKDHSEDLNQMDKFCEECSSDNGGINPKKVVDGRIQCNERKGGDFKEESAQAACEGTFKSIRNQFAKETLENGDGCESYHEVDMFSGGHGLQVPKNCFDVRKAMQGYLKAPRLANSTLDGRILDHNMSLEIDQEVVVGKRKKNAVDMVSDATASKNLCTFTADAVALLPSNSQTSATSSKRQRVVHDSVEQQSCFLNMESNEECSSAKDRGELDAGVTIRFVEEAGIDMQQENMLSEDSQVDGNQNTCIICKLGGKLLCCEGRGCCKSYHLSCLDPPLEDVPFGLWLCPACIIKKIYSSVYSVSEGIESILDAREFGVSNDSGLERQKQYFVKYKGLAHVYNQWIPESGLPPEALPLVAKFSRRNQGVMWKQEWTVPHRLLQKRLLMSFEQYRKYHYGHVGKKTNCHYEWLVKWHGLDYEHATWELETASFISSPEGQSLMQDYESRREKSRRASYFSKLDKQHAQESGKDVSAKSSNSAAGGLAGLPINFKFANKLREYWHNCQNAIIFDDQERIRNIISLIVSISSNVNRPFLIISTSAALNSWEEEFLHLAPFITTVVYVGSAGLRKNIRTLEFYEEEGCILFQVLVTSPEVFSEDVDVLANIRWEAIIIDECQRPRISSLFEQIKMFNTDLRLLIVSGQLRDSMADYQNMISLLDFNSNSNKSDRLRINSNENIGNLKERLENYIAYKCKSESSFLEYWVPVQISDVQLEQYCATLLSNSLTLCSPSRNDPVGVLPNVLISTRKCCDHPYVVDQSLQMSLTKNLKETDYLDVGIKVSGKLQCLEAMLLEIKEQGLRVLILFQSIGGSGRNVIGDILDDFLRQRFGKDSYERIDGGVIPSKKQSALHKFNKESGRFVFLLETRACSSSIKLLLVSTVIIFGSDWNPMNDLRALQKVTLDSQFEQIKVFRLYSAFTVEEKILVFAKHNKIFDSNVQNISPKNSHLLLMWGASYLFSRLNEFHDRSTVNKSILQDVLNEFLSILTENREDSNPSKSPLILLAKQKQGPYRTDFPLFGERKIKVMDKDLPHVFWTKQLDGKHPQWKYSSASFQRNRKRAQHLDSLQKVSGEVLKKQKVVSENIDATTLKASPQEKMVAGNKEGILGVTAPTLSHPLSECEERRKLLDSQKALHVFLKPEIAKLCEILHLPEDVRGMAERFLEYVMNNHIIDRMATMLQAFQISLCWTAASLLKQKIPHKESLTLAKTHLNFGCKKDEADYFYSLLCCMKKLFLCHTSMVHNSPKLTEPSTKASMGRDKCVASVSGLPLEYELVQKDLLKSIKTIEKKCNKQMEKLVLKLKEDKEGLNKKHEEEKAELESKKRMEEAVIRLHGIVSLRNDKRMKLDEEFEEKFEELKHQNDILHKNLEASHEAARNCITKRMINWVNAVKSWAQNELTKPLLSKSNLSEELSSAENVHSMPGSQATLPDVCQNIHDEVVAHGDPDDAVSPSREKANTGASASEGSEARLPDIWRNIPDEVVAHGDPDNTVNRPVSPGCERANAGASASEGSEARLPDICQNIPDEVVAHGDPNDSVTLQVSPRHEKANAGASTSERGEARLPDICQNIPCEVVAHGDQNDAVALPVSPSHERANAAASASDGNKARLPDICQNIPDEVLAHGDPNNTVTLPVRPSREKANAGASASEGSEATLPDICQNIPDEVTAHGDPDDIITLPISPSCEKANAGAFASVGCDRAVCSASDQGLASKDDCSRQVPAGHIPDGEVGLDIPATSTDGPDHICDKFTENIPDRETMTETVYSSEIVSCADGLENSSHRQIPDATSACLPNGQVVLVESEVTRLEVQEGSNLSKRYSLSVSEGEASPIATEIVHSSSLENIVSVNPSPSEAQITMLAPSCIPVGELQFSERETAPRDVQGSCNTDKENDGASSTGLNQQDGVACTENQEPQSQEPALVHLTPDRHVLTSPSNQVREALFSPLYTSSEAEGEAGDATNKELENTSLALEPSTSHAAADTSVTEVLQIQPLRSIEPPSNRTSGNLPLVSGIEHQASYEGQISLAHTHPVEHRNELFNHNSLHSLANFTPHSLIDAPVGGIGRHILDTSGGPINSGSSNHPLQTAPAVSSHMPFPLYRDPLQNELERIRKETEQIVKLFGETKIELNSLCEKEIEKAVADIRRKYEIKLKEKEAKFLLMKKELDVNNSLCYVNKMLAECFRSKCMDRTSGSSRTLQEVSSSFAQQLVQLSSQQTAQRPASTAGLPSLGLTPAGMQATVTPAMSVQSGALPMVTPQAMGPSLQAALHSSPYLSGAATRPPLVNSVTPPVGNFTCYPPHLRPFSRSTSMSSSNPVSWMPIRPVYSNSPTASPSPLRPYCSSAPRMAPTICQPGIIHRSDRVRGPTALPDSSQAALNILTDVANQNLPTRLPPDVSNFATLVQQEPGIPSSTSSNPAQPSVAVDVVFVSDEE